MTALPVPMHPRSAEVRQAKSVATPGGAPRNAKSRSELAQSLAKSGRLAEAVQAYSEVLALEPGNEKLQLSLADIYRRVHNDEEARGILQIARRQHPRSVEVLRAIANLELDGRAYDAAVEALRTALKITPSNSDLRNLLATAYLENSAPRRALEQLNIVLQRDPSDASALFLRAGIYSDTGENDKALADAGKVVSLRPDNMAGRMLYAKLLVRFKDCQRAVEILHPPDKAPHADPEGLFLLANAYDCAGKKELADDARSEFGAESRREHEKAENQVQSLHLVEQANALALQNKLPEAQELLRQALEKNPENAFAYAQEAKIYFSIRQPQQASEAIDKALSLQPYQPDFLFVRGVIDASKGKLETALASFRSVTYVNPKEADAYYEMGKILMKENNGTQALAAFRKAAELDPEDKDYREAVKLASEKARYP